MCTDHVNSTPILSTTVYIMSVLFFLFSWFSGNVTSITILGNAHRPCKHLSNITTPSLFFSWFYCYFFHLKLQNLPYLAIFSVHSGHWIPVTFRSSQFWGLFQWNYWNIKILPQEWKFQYFTLPGLFHVESMEGGMDCRNSMEWGDGFHGMGDGFHTFSRWIPYYFHMESRWNKFLES